MTLIKNNQADGEKKTIQLKAKKTKGNKNRRTGDTDNGYMSLTSFKITMPNKLVYSKI